MNEVKSGEPSVPAMDIAPSMRTFVLIAAINGFLSVAFGAFGAHALKDKLSPENAAIWQTATHYHIAHTLALLGIAAIIGIRGESKLLSASGWLITAGIVLFSGSLYALALTDSPKIGIITPFGGLCFLAGWTMLAIAAWKGLRR